MTAQDGIDDGTVEYAATYLNILLAHVGLRESTARVNHSGTYVEIDLSAEAAETVKARVFGEGLDVALVFGLADMGIRPASGSERPDGTKLVMSNDAARQLIHLIITRFGHEYLLPRPSPLGRIGDDLPYEPCETCIGIAREWRSVKGDAPESQVARGSCQALYALHVQKVHPEVPAPGPDVEACGDCRRLVAAVETGTKEKSVLERHLLAHLIDRVVTV